MRKIHQTDDQHTRRGLSAALLILAIVTLAIFAWLMFTALLPEWLGWSAFSYVVDSIVDASGWDRNLVRAVAILLLLPFIWAVSEVVRIGLGNRLKDAWRGRHSSVYRKRAAAVLLVLYASSFFGVMFLASRDANFAFSSGEARRFYAQTPEGVRLFPEDGHDPKYGMKLQPVTRDIIESIERARLGLRPDPISPKRIPTLDFFDANTGASLVWYFEKPDGHYDLFSSAGFHPTVGEPLRPVTAEVAQTVRQDAADERAEADRLTNEEIAARLAAQEAARAADEKRASALSGKFL